MSKLFDFTDITPLSDIQLQQALDVNQVSFAAIKEGLIERVKALGDYEKWEDWYKSSAGSITLDWVAAIGAFEAYHTLAMKRETSLYTAVKYDSILDLAAAQKGLLLGPQETAEIKLTVEPEVSDEPVHIQKGQSIGSIQNYELYALDDYDIESIGQEIVVAVGNKVTHTQIYTPKKFDTLTFYLDGKYLAHQLESFVIDGQINIDLVTAHSVYLNTQTNPTYLLRRYKTNKSIIYIGDSLLGWYNNNASNYTYSYLSFGDDVNKVIEQKVTVSIPIVVTEQEVIKIATFVPDMELFRNKAINYRGNENTLVVDEDYSAYIVANWGGYFYDVYCYNSGPTEEIYLLFKDPEISGTQAYEVVDTINKNVDSLRALGMPVNYHVFRADGVLLNKYTYARPFEHNVNTGKYWIDVGYVLPQVPLIKSNDIIKDSEEVTARVIAQTSDTTFDIDVNVEEFGMDIEIGLILRKEDYNDTNKTAIQSMIDEFKFKISEGQVIIMNDLVLDLSSKIGFPIAAIYPDQRIDIERGNFIKNISYFYEISD